jgi:hypothetical protein
MVAPGVALQAVLCRRPTVPYRDTASLNGGSPSLSAAERLFGTWDLMRQAKKALVAERHSMARVKKRFLLPEKTVRHARNTIQRARSRLLPVCTASGRLLAAVLRVSNALLLERATVLPAASGLLLEHAAVLPASNGLL